MKECNVEIQRSLVGAFACLAVMVGAGAVAQASDAPSWADLLEQSKTAPDVADGAGDRSARRAPGLAGTRFRDALSGGGDGPEMVVIPSGSFRMGSPLGEQGRRNNEGPVHRVTIREAFALGVKEVTRGEFARFVEDTGCSAGNRCRVWDGGWKGGDGRNWRNPGYGQSDSHPVTCVNWEDARAYARWLSGRTGEGYRLPSESEWEYAARGGTRTARYWGESASGQCSYANGADASTDFSWATDCDDGHARAAPSGSFEPNAYGLHDMLGNVWEWTQDCWNGNYSGAPSDGSAWLSGNCSLRVLRGGSWGGDPRNLRAAYRGRDDTDSRGHDVGFRVSRTLAP